MNGQNEKRMSVSFKMEFTRKGSNHYPWLKWIEIAITVIAIAVHVITLI